MDISGPWPISYNGKKYVIVLVCACTRYVIMQATASCEAIVIPNFIYGQVIMIHGAIKELVIDNGPQFIARLIRVI